MFTRFTGIASSDCDTISIHCIIKFYLDFFQKIKLCCQEHVQASRIYTHEFLRKKQFFLTFWVWLYKKQLGSLRGIYHSPRCCWYVKSLLFSFWVYMIKGDDTLTEISPFEVKWVEQKSIQTLQPSETKIIQMRMYQFKLAKSQTYFYDVVMIMYNLTRWKGII